MSWFDITARANFEKHLLPLCDQPLYCLQLGCFEGDASVWLMENLPHCVLDDVDTFEGSEEHDEFDMLEVKHIYDDRTAPYEHRIKTWVGDTTLIAQWDWKVDFVYVDADHHATSVLRDAVLAWPLLKPGGLMAFDDYEWGQSVPVLDTPQPAINAFVGVFREELEIMEQNVQVWVRKR